MIKTMNFKKLAIAALTLMAGPVFSKNFYMTVRRDFAPSEIPNIELIYNNDIPITLRLLKPKDMKSFIQEQIDLRRAWKEPVNEFNSARYLLRGMNLTQVNPDWIRYNVKSSVRDPFKKQYGGADFYENGTSISEGPKKIIRAPKDFEVVSEFSIDPSESDDRKPFDVPGFNWYLGSTSSYRNRLVTLPAQKSGFYVLQAVQGTDEGQILVVVNDIRALLEQTDKKALLRATDRAGSPLNGAKVSLRSVDGKWIESAETDKNGVATLATGDSTELVAVVEKGDSTAIIDTEFLSSDSNFPDVFIYSDRPMYKPQNTAQFKGILRHKESGISKIFGSSNSVSTALYSTEGEVIAEGESSKITDFGSFSGSVALDTDTAGVYRIQATVDDQQHFGEIRVKDYVKPLFFVNVNSSVDSLKPGQTFPITVKSERYAGGVPGALRARIEVLRVRYDGPEWAADAGLGEAGNATTYGFSGDAKTPIIPISVHVMEDVDLGSTGTKAVQVTLPAQLPGDEGYDYKLSLRVRAVDSDGNSASASKSFFEATKDLLLQVRASGVYVENGQPANLDVRALTPAGNPFGKTSGDVKFFHQAYGAEATLLSEQSFETDEQGKVKLKFPTDKIGTIIAKVNLKDKSGKTESNETEILVADPKSTDPIKKVLDPTLLTRRDTYLEGETAKALLLLPEGWGVKGSNHGTIYTTVAGRSIYSNNAESLKGQSYWINLKLTEDLGSAAYVLLSYADPLVGFVQKTIRFRILPADKSLKVTIKAADEIVEPGAEQSLKLQVSDYKGNPIKSEVSLSVVDRAVLDLQPEFRPMLMDFFYPMDRLNLMSFFSGEFQSYGYAETVAKLFKGNYWFSSTKPDAEPKREEDTAYWNPVVMTDAKGQATVKFRLPINQTIWKTTAVAIDQDGRFGEGNSEFKAQTNLPITVALPTQIRQGETFYMRFQAENLSKNKTRTLNLNLSLPKGFETQDPVAQKDLKIGPSEKFGYRLQVKARDDLEIGKLDVVAKVVVDGEDRSFTQDITVIDGSVVSPIRRDLIPDQPLKMELAQGESLADVRVRTFEGFSGTVVPALQWMTTYPFGCVEQLVNTTLPNLAIASVLGLETKIITEVTETLGFWAKVKHFFVTIYEWITGIFGSGSPKLSDEQTKALQTAIDNSKLGLGKIQALQVKDGDRRGLFNWFSGVGGDLRLQYFVLTSLASVEDGALLTGIDVKAAYQALANHRYTYQNEYTAVIDIYLKGQFSHLKLIDETIGASDLRFIMEGALKDSNPLLMAYALRTLNYADKEAANSVKDLRPTLIKNLSEKLSEVLKLEMTDQNYLQRAVVQNWSGYMGRPGSLIALMARALFEAKSLSKELKNDVRDRLASLFNGESYGSTYESGQILLNSVWLVKDEIENRKAGSAPTVKMNGQEVKGEASLILAGWEIPVSGEALKNSGVEFQVSGSKKLIKAKLIANRRTPMKSVTPIVGKSLLERSFYKLNETTQQLTPLSEGSDLNIGDLIYIEHDIQAADKGSYFASSYYVLQSDIPSGTSLVEDDDRFSKLNVYADRSGWKKREEIKGKLNYYFDFERGWMDAVRSGRKVGFVVRVNYAGNFYGGVSRFEDFYDDEGFSQTGAFSFAVQPPVAR